MGASRPVCAAGWVLLALSLTSCSGESVDEPPAESGALPQGSEPLEVDPDDFSTTIDNEYFPLEPGARLVYREVEDGTTTRVVVTVTDQTRTVAAGMTGRVVRDTVTEDGEIVEDTLDWYAQDSDGNVWYLGEETAEFEDGEITTRKGSWEAGVAGALPGVIMPAEPAAGQAYRQEYLEGEAEDNGAVLGTDEMADVLAGHYDHLVLTKDTSGVETDVLELKLYAPGVGTVLTLGVSGGVGREELVRVGEVPGHVASSAGTAPLGEPYG